MPKTTIASFVLRFTQELGSDTEPLAPWRAVIRHVQSDEEAHFTRMDEALAFMGHYVDLPEGGPHDDESRKEDEARTRKSRAEPSARDALDRGG